MTLGPVAYQILVNGVPFNPAPAPMVVDCQLTMEHGLHDMFSFRIEYPLAVSAKLTNLSMLPDGAPVQVNWGRLPQLSTWYGYINHHEISSHADSGTHASQVTYVCIGTSAALNVAATKTWQEVSPTYIAKSIAAANGLRSVTTPISYPLAYEVQAGETDFQFLSRIANKTGMRFWVSGGTLYMISPSSALEGSGSGAIPSFTVNKSQIALDTCRDFCSYTGSNLPGSVQSNRVIYGIDATSGRPFAASSQPSTQTSRVSVKTDYAATNAQEAQNRVNAWSALSQFWVGATASLLGNTNIYPGKLVLLAGQAMPDNGSGYWLVSQAVHNMSNSATKQTTLDNYWVDVTLLRNTNTTGTLTLANTTPVNPEVVTCALNTSGNWVATDTSAVSLPATALP